MSECQMSKQKDSDRLNPKNMAVAMAYQIHDDVRVFYSLAYSGNPDGIESALNALQSHIDYLRSVGRKRWIYPTEQKSK